MQIDDIHIGHLYKGKNAGLFVVLGHRIIAGQPMVQLKAVDPQTEQMLPGELTLPPDALQPNK